MHLEIRSTISSGALEIVKELNQLQKRTKELEHKLKSIDDGFMYVGFEHSGGIKCFYNKYSLLQESSMFHKILTNNLNHCITESSEDLFTVEVVSTKTLVEAIK